MTERSIGSKVDIFFKNHAREIYLSGSILATGLAVGGGVATANKVEGIYAEEDRLSLEDKGPNSPAGQRISELSRDVAGISGLYFAAEGLLITIAVASAIQAYKEIKRV